MSLRTQRWITCFQILLLFTGCAPAPRAGAPATQAGAPATRASAKPPPNWESAIAAFEKQDQQTAPPEHPILFVGSSTVRFWKVKDAFLDQPVLNRGFGGSQIDDVLYYFDRVVARYQPRTIVFYSGDNDLAAGKSVERVVDDMHQFIELVRKKCAGTKLIVIAIKPSIARWNLIDKIRQANVQIEKDVQALPGAVFVNVESKLLVDGKPNHDLFRPDGLHLNAKGYAILDDAVRPYLEK